MFYTFGRSHPVQKSDMIIEIHSDASYLSNTKAHSQADRNLFLTTKNKKFKPMMNNGVVHVVSPIIHIVISSASKAKIAAMYPNEKYGVIIWNIL